MYSGKLAGLLALWLGLGLALGGGPRPELVQVLFRHGARAPIACEAKFVGNNRSLYEPWGLAQLTTQGMRQEYQIGEMLRERYAGLLAGAYRPEYVYAYASAVSRTKTSLELVLAALFPPSGRLTWNPELRWLPVPTFSSPRPMDVLVKSRDCPKYKRALRDALDSPEMRQEAAKHDELVDLMERTYGQRLGFEELFCLYNAIVVHKNMDLPLPSWYSERVFAQLHDAGQFQLEALSHTATLRRLNGGPLVRRFAENLRASEARPQGRRIYLYSAHDKSLHAFARAHNLTLPRTPDYGSALILEKLRDESGRLYVKLLLWSGEPKALSALRLDGCAETCELDRYLAIVGPALPSDEEMRCLLEDLRPRDIERILNTDEVNVED